MSVTSARTQRLVAASLTVYETLLLLYPPRFREAFAEEMARTFRDACRDAARTGGWPGLARVWWITLGDLLTSALSEHTERIEEALMMEQGSLPRAAGLAGLIGGALLLLYAVISLLAIGTYLAPNDTFYTSTLFDARSALFLSVSWAQTMVMPLVWICAMVVLWGMISRFAPHGGAALWLVGAVTLFGALKCFLGTVSLIIGGWNSWYYGHDTYFTYQSQLSGDPTPYLASLDLFGRMLVGAGLLALVVVAWRLAQKRFLAIPLVLGAVALLPHLYLYLAGPTAILQAVPAGDHFGERLIWTPFTLPWPAVFQYPFSILLIDTVFALVWAIGLLLLGRGYLRSGQAAATQPAPAPALGLNA